MQISEACRSLLKKGDRYGHLYRKNLSNHLPMALVALDKMGANGAQLHRFYDSYVGKLEERLENTAVQTLSDYRSELGAADNFPGLVKYFEREIADRGYEAVLAKMVPALIPGIAASGFHAAIRLAYAIDAGNVDDFPLCLAFWVSEYYPLCSERRQVDETLDQIFDRLAVYFIDYEYTVGTVTHEMGQSCEMINHHGGALQPERIALSDIAKFSISRYALAANFNVLHTVTGCHGFRVLWPFVGDKERALRYLWQSVVVACLSNGVDKGEGQSAQEIETANWTDIVSSVLGSDNDHKIKLVYSCWQEWREYDNPLYIAVARETAANG